MRMEFQVKEEIVVGGHGENFYFSKLKKYVKVGILPWETKLLSHLISLLLNNRLKAYLVLL